VINQYKRLDVFRCKLDSHESFEGKVSVYHVLKVKRCLPEGCFYFKWHCRLLEKRTSCKKGYKHPGKNCNSCRYYYEEKLHKVPEIILNQEQYKEFLRELERFEDWLSDHLGRRLEVYGRVNFVGSRLIKTVYPKNSRLSLKGYLVNFAECYLGRTHLEDFVYLQLSPGAQKRLRLARGDRVEFEAELTLDEGRLVLRAPRKLDFQERDPDTFEPDLSAALVDSRVASLLNDQTEKCLNCERGRLVDVVEKNIGQARFLRRELFCLEGVRDPSICSYNALKELGIRRAGSFQS
jgi:hypothetical protein